MFIARTANACYFQLTQSEYDSLGQPERISLQRTQHGLLVKSDPKGNKPTKRTIRGASEYSVSIKPRLLPGDKLFALERVETTEVPEEPGALVADIPTMNKAPAHQGPADKKQPQKPTVLFAPSTEGLSAAVKLVNKCKTELGSLVELRVDAETGMLRVVILQEFS